MTAEEAQRIIGESAPLVRIEDLFYGAVGREKWEGRPLILACWALPLTGMEGPEFALWPWIPLHGGRDWPKRYVRKEVKLIMDQPLTKGIDARPVLVYGTVEFKPVHEDGFKVADALMRGKKLRQLSVQ